MKVTIKEPGLGVKPTASEMELSSRWKMEQARKDACGEAPRRLASLRSTDIGRHQREPIAFREER